MAAITGRRGVDTALRPWQAAQLRVRADTRPDACVEAYHVDILERQIESGRQKPVAFAGGRKLRLVWRTGDPCWTG